LVAPILRKLGCGANWPLHLLCRLSIPKKNISIFFHLPVHSSMKDPPQPAAMIKVNQIILAQALLPAFSVVVGYQSIVLTPRDGPYEPLLSFGLCGRKVLYKLLCVVRPQDASCEKLEPASTFYSALFSTHAGCRCTPSFRTFILYLPSFHSFITEPLLSYKGYRRAHMPGGARSASWPPRRSLSSCCRFPAIYA
jgi:hypothetical protein